MICCNNYGDMLKTHPRRIVSCIDLYFSKVMLRRIYVKPITRECV
jgi:hypothetical protein